MKGPIAYLGVTIMRVIVAWRRGMRYLSRQYARTARFVLYMALTAGAPLLFLVWMAKVFHGNPVAASVSVLAVCGWIWGVCEPIRAGLKME